MGEGEGLRKNFSVKMLLRLRSGSWEGFAQCRQRESKNTVRAKAGQGV